MHDDGTCNSDNAVFTVRRHETQYMITSVILYVCIAIMVVCTIYIVCKLTICRKRLQSNITNAVERRNKRSAVIVVFICIIFILSEAIHIAATAIFSKPNSSDVSVFAKNLAQFVLISWEVGFSMNFIVYLVLSKQLRKTICKVFRRRGIFSFKNSGSGVEISTSSFKMENTTKSR